MFGNEIEKDIMLGDYHSYSRLTDFPFYELGREIVADVEELRRYATRMLLAVARNETPADIFGGKIFTPMENTMSYIVRQGASLGKMYTTEDILEIRSEVNKMAHTYLDELSDMYQWHCMPAQFINGGVVNNLDGSVAGMRIRLTNDLSGFGNTAQNVNVGNDVYAAMSTLLVRL